MKNINTDIYLLHCQHYSDYNTANQILKEKPSCLRDNIFLEKLGSVDKKLGDKFYSSRDNLRRLKYNIITRFTSKNRIFPFVL